MALRRHLLRDDRQEDLCFALWYPSRGSSRTSALVREVLLPDYGDRTVHGNVSFNSHYFERALAAAAKAKAGLALLHSHPMGRGWQDMSRDDINTERNSTGAAFGATGLPLVGLTLAADGAWSGRFWERTAPRTYTRHWCRNVRVVGNRLSVTYMDALCPRPRPTDQQVRTISAWGDEAQAHLVRLRVGLIGAGSVGGFIGECLARTGFVDIVPIDFDSIEVVNLDRLLYATRADIGQPKVDILTRRMRAISTAERAVITPVNAAVYEEEGFRSALDCDLLLSCVDRPWGRHVLNFIAYAHLIPVVDGGIYARTNRSGRLAAADWRAHTATVGRPCLQCLGQYDPSLVEVERRGLLDDPRYIQGLPKDHDLRARENVFAFSMSCASLQILQMLSLVLAPLDRSNPGAQRYHFVGGEMEPPIFGGCHPECLSRQFAAFGDSAQVSITGQRPGGRAPDIKPTRPYLTRLWSSFAKRIYQR